MDSVIYNILLSSCRLLITASLYPRHAAFKLTCYLQITNSHPSESTADGSGSNAADDRSNGSASSVENGHVPEAKKAPKDEIQIALERRKYVLLVRTDPAILRGVEPRIAVPEASIRLRTARWNNFCSIILNFE